MKKTLIALAAVAATGAAFAQSSVTLYGVADLSVGDTNAETAAGVSVDKFRAIANGILNNGNSRWGVRGTEDLGGGLKAGFNFEQGVNLANGATDVKCATGTGTATVPCVVETATTFQRAANLSLMGGFGEVRLGRSLTTSFYSVASWELTGTANYSVVANQFGFAGAGSRNDAAIMYFSPNMGGFTVGASTVLEGNTGTKAKYDLSLGYANGPLAVSLAYNNQDGDGNIEGMALGAKYNFGAFTIAGSYQDSERTAKAATATAPAVTALEKKGYTLGATTNVGPVALTVDIARDTEAKDTDLLLEAKYPLSKRTFVYGVVYRDGKGDTLGGADDTTGYAVGIRHNF